jgi:hypothetical protein
MPPDVIESPTIKAAPLSCVPARAGEPHDHIPRRALWKGGRCEPQESQTPRTGGPGATADSSSRHLAAPLEGDEFTYS